MASSAVAMMIFFTACQEAVSPETGLRRLLPGSVGDWQRQGEILEYSGEALFDYINGGAEIYFEYGFVKVIVQDYMVAGEHTLTLEIYEMVDPESAYGIYSFKRSPGGRSADIGAESRLEDYYLNFWKGNYLVTLTGFDQEPTTVAGLLSVARSVDEVMHEGGSPPSLEGRLPYAGRVEAGIKYFKGLLGLYNSYAFAQEDIFSLEEGIRIEYESGVSLFLFQYSDSEKAKTVFLRSRAFFETSPRYSGYQQLGSAAIRVTDAEERLLVMEAFQSYLFLVLTPQDPGAAEELRAEIRAGLRKE